MEEKSISLTILGVVAIIAIVGLVLLFTGGATGEVAGMECKEGYYRHSAQSASAAIKQGGDCYQKIGEWYCCKPRGLVI